MRRGREVLRKRGQQGHAPLDVAPSRLPQLHTLSLADVSADLRRFRFAPPCRPSGLTRCRRGRRDIGTSDRSRCTRDRLDAELSTWCAWRFTSLHSLVATPSQRRTTRPRRRDVSRPHWWAAGAPQPDRDTITTTAAA